MRIKRLDITGFKSFMERSVFSFGEGVTCIVGPNGCGKSNLVDAIRWVMGEQSAKNLRGRGMEDVIFNGSETEPPRSMAEVSLTMSVDSADTLSSPYAGLSEMTVTRRMFRDGNSEYLINKSPCRLLDIVELFLGTGVGSRAYSIIEQGRVGLIISAKPEDRRAFIEEAAGVSKYKGRRRAAERKIEYTQQNLLRVSDIVVELGRHLESLEKQAKKAEKYKSLKSEIREIELHSASMKFLEYQIAHAACVQRLDTIANEEREAVGQLEDLENKIDAGRSQLVEESARLDHSQRSVLDLESEIKLNGQSMLHCRRELTALEAGGDQFELELAALRLKETELTAGIAQSQAELSNLSGTSQEEERILHSLQSELSEASQVESVWVSRIEEERKALVQIVGRVAQLENSLQNAERGKSDLGHRIEKLKSDRSPLMAEAATLELTRREILDRVTERKRSACDLAERKGTEEAVWSSIRQQFAENEIQVISAREDLSDKRSRLSSLKEIQRNYEGFDRGVRAVMGKLGDDPRAMGVRGLVADVFTSAPQFEKAIEAVLGERLQQVVIDKREDARHWIESLKLSNEGRSSFVPLQFDRTTSTGRGGRNFEMNQPGVLARAADQVKAEPVFLDLIEQLLGDVVIVTDLATAFRCASPGVAICTLVTLEGEILRADGTVTGGVLEGPAVGALQKKREIGELVVEVELLEAHYTQIITHHYYLQKQTALTEGVLKGLAKSQHAEEIQLASDVKDAQRAGEELVRLTERIRSLGGDEEQLTSAWEALVEEVKVAQEELAHFYLERDQREGNLGRGSNQLADLRQKTQHLAEQLTVVRVQVAARQERNQAAQSRGRELIDQLSEIQSRAEKLLRQFEEGGSKKASMLEKLQTLQSRQGEWDEGLKTLVETHHLLKAGHDAFAASVLEQDALLRVTRSRLAELSQEVSEAALKDREVSLELNHLIEQVHESHQADLLAEVQQYHLLPLPSSESEKKVSMLKLQVERMGEINLTAIDEKAELAERFEFLKGQRSDLESSLSQLKEAIAKLDKASQSRFNETFEAVNAQFQTVFPRMFGGGRASLVMTQEGPGMENGIEIIVQPPGKKLQNVNLLSGGEKALTSVSLIFSIFMIKPTPFCLLDEVDAPLDEANVGRYNEMVKQMSSQSQFILITHNKKTMEVADTLYGITMEEAGISKLVSVKMLEAIAHNDNIAA